MEEKHLDEFTKLEEERKKAVENSDNLRIYEIYNQLGLEPEPRIKHNYELGQIEARPGKLEEFVEQKIKMKRKRSVPNSTYEKFYQNSSRLSLNIGENSDIKRELLIKYFPGRFGDEGRNPVCDMNYLSVGKLFRKVVEYSKERINQ